MGQQIHSILEITVQVKSILLYRGVGSRYTNEAAVQSDTPPNTWQETKDRQWKDTKVNH